MRYLRSSEMTSLFACMSDLTLFVSMDPQGLKGSWDCARAFACHDEINETEVALPRIDRCALYDGFCCRQEPTSLLSPSHLVDAGKAANPIQHTESACGIRFTSSTTCTLLW